MTDLTTTAAPLVASANTTSSEVDALIQAAAVQLQETSDALQDVADSLSDMSKAIADVLRAHAETY